MKQLLSVLLFFAVMATASAQTNVVTENERRSFVAYPCADGDPQTWQPIVAALVSEGGLVSIDPTQARLLVVATKAEHATIAPLLKKAITVPRNIQIRVSYQGSGSSSQQSIGISDVHGRVKIGSSGSKDSISITPQLESRSGTHVNNTDMLLTVASGRSGTLAVGTSVPYIEWINKYAYNWGYETYVVWEDVGSFLSVHPTLLADEKTIRIQLVPELRGLVDGKRRIISYEKLATEVYVTNGQSMQIGGHGKHQDFYNHFLIGTSSGGQQNRLNISLTPTLLPKIGPR